MFLYLAMSDDSIDFERFKAFAQLMKHSSISMLIPIIGFFPFTDICSSKYSSQINVAFPLTRIVSAKPGIMKRIPILELVKILRIVSILLFPGRSGITKCFSLFTNTKPGSSPRGDTSQYPYSLELKDKVMNFCFV